MSIHIHNHGLFVIGDGWNSVSTTRQADGTESMSIVGVGQSRSKISFKALSRQTARGQLVSEVIDLVCHVKFKGRHLHPKKKRTMIFEKTRYVKISFKRREKNVVGSVEMDEDAIRRNLNRLHSANRIPLFLPRIWKLRLS